MQKRDDLLRIIVLALLMVGLYPISFGQGDNLKPVTSKYAIRNATIIQAPGKKIERGTVVINKGVIKAVGSNVSIPSDAWVIDADSMFIYAGFIDGLSNTGIPKPKEEQKETDRKLRGNPSYESAGITPNVSARDLIDPKEKSIKEYRALGFTAAHVVPHNGMIPGTGSIILLGGASADDMIITGTSSLYSQLKGANRVYPATVIGVMAKYRDMYRKADQAQAYEKRYKNANLGMERPTSDKMIEALYPIVNKEMPVLFKAEKVLDISRVLTLQQDLGFDLMLGEVKEGWDIVAEIKKSSSGVFLSLDLPEKEEKKEKKDEKKEDNADNKEEEEEVKEKTAEELEKEALEQRKSEMIGRYYTQPSLFANQGVKFGFSTMESKSKDFKKTLIKLIDQGLTEDQALAALTTNPAGILNLSSMMGTVEKGKMANLVITDKSYFDEESKVRYVFVDGVMYEYKEEKKKKKKSGGETTVDILGKWSYTTETPQGDGTGVITITGNPGDYSGTITLSFNGSTNELQNIEMDGNTLSFSFTIDMGEEITIDATLNMEGDSFEGSLSAPGAGGFPIEGSKEPEKF